MNDYGSTDRAPRRPHDPAERFLQMTSVAASLSTTRAIGGIPMTVIFVDPPR